MRFHEGVWIRLVRGKINSGRVEIIQICRPYDVLGNSGSQCDSHPIDLVALGIPGALAA
jgi:hypothetical protein